MIVFNCSKRFRMNFGRRGELLQALASFGSAIFKELSKCHLGNLFQKLVGAARGIGCGKNFFHFQKFRAGLVVFLHPHQRFPHRKVGVAEL